MKANATNLLSFTPRPLQTPLRVICKPEFRSPFEAHHFAKHLQSKDKRLYHCKILPVKMRGVTWNRFPILKTFADSNPSPLWRLVALIQICADLNHRKKAETSGFVPRTLAANVALVVVKCNPNSKESKNDENSYHTLAFPTAPPDEELPINNNYSSSELSSESDSDMEEVDWTK